MYRLTILTLLACSFLPKAEAGRSLLPHQQEAIQRFGNASAHSIPVDQSFLCQFHPVSHGTLKSSFHTVKITRNFLGFYSMSIDETEYQLDDISGPSKSFSAPTLRAAYLNGAQIHSIFVRPGMNANALTLHLELAIPPSSDFPGIAPSQVEPQLMALSYGRCIEDSQALGTPPPAKEIWPDSIWSRDETGAVGASADPKKHKPTDQPAGQMDVAFGQDPPLSQNSHLSTLSPPLLPPLLQAIENEEVAEVEKLLNDGRDPTFVNTNGLNAIQFASQVGSARTLELLLDHLAKTGKLDAINARETSQGYTALHLAAAEGQLEVVQILLDRKADSTLFSNDGSTAHAVASDNGCHDVHLEFNRREKTHRKTSERDFWDPTTKERQFARTQQFDPGIASVTAIPGKGLGLVVTKTIKTNTLLALYAVDLVTDEVENAASGLIDIDAISKYSLSNKQEKAFADFVSGSGNFDTEYAIGVIYKGKTLLGFPLNPKTRHLDKKLRPYLGHLINDAAMLKIPSPGVTQVDMNVIVKTYLDAANLHVNSKIEDSRIQKTDGYTFIKIKAGRKIEGTPGNPVELLFFYGPNYWLGRAFEELHIENPEIQASIHQLYNIAATKWIRSYKSQNSGSVPFWWPEDFKETQEPPFDQ